MISHEALPGVRVRVSQDNRRPELRGMVGTVATRFGDADYAALDVVLDNGQLELFWHYQLEKADQVLGA